MTKEISNFSSPCFPKKKKQLLAMAIQNILSNSQYTFLGPAKLDFLCNSLRIKFVFQTRNKLVYVYSQSPFQAKLLKYKYFLYTLIVLNTKFDPNQIFTAKSAHEFHIYFRIKPWVNHNQKEYFLFSHFCKRFKTKWREKGVFFLS